MMTSKLNSFIVIFSIMTLFIITGCESVKDVMVDTMQPDPSMEAAAVKLVLLVDYPEGGKDAYIAWVASVAATLQAPEEVVRIRSYDNVDETMSPNRIVEFDFDSFLDSAAYFNRPEIAAIFEDIPNHTSVATMHTFIERSDYDKTDEGNYPIKGVLFINYPLGGKQAYLDWVDSQSSTIVGPTELKAVASYDNYYGGIPHRLVEFEYASQEDADSYAELEEIKALEDELDTRASSWVLHTFQLRSDYINE